MYFVILQPDSSTYLILDQFAQAPQSTEASGSASVIIFSFSNKTDDNKRPVGIQNIPRKRSTTKRI